MKRLKERFIEIVKLELEDLKEDIEQLIEESQLEKLNSRISEYVYLENLAVLKNELLGVGSFGRILESLQPDEYASLDEMIAATKELFKSEIKRCGLAPAIEGFVDRKIAKVVRYISG